MGENEISRSQASPAPVTSYGDDYLFSDLLLRGRNDGQWKAEGGRKSPDLTVVMMGGRPYLKAPPPVRQGKPEEKRGSNLTSQGTSPMEVTERQLVATTCLPSVDGGSEVEI